MELIFELGSEIIIVKIEGRSISFSSAQNNYQGFFPIDFLKFSKEGIVKEFPDLKDKEFGEAKKEAIRRFKLHISSLEKLDDIKAYVIEEFEKMGYILRTVKREGFRAKNERT